MGRRQNGIKRGERDSLSLSENGRKRGPSPLGNRKAGRRRGGKGEGEKALLAEGESEREEPERGPL